MAPWVVVAPEVVVHPAAATEDPARNRHGAVERDGEGDGEGDVVDERQGDRRDGLLVQLTGSSRAGTCLW